ncbi:MAG: outer membrane lipoprotein LolB [Steroidobacteraceae bacterium]|nr:outer membrane lipoprotein LolB [Deltaproteobacteria bacterium]
MFIKLLMRFLIIAAPLLLAACSMARPALVYSPGATVDTLSAAVSLSVTTADSGMSGSGFLVYRRPDQLHLVLLSPFGTTMIEIFSNGEQITLLYPGSSTAYVGRIADLPVKGGLQGWRLMRWVMDAAPSDLPGQNGTIERTGSHGVVEKVTFENGLVTAKSTKNGDKVYYSRYTVAGGVPFAAELDLRNSQDDRIRMVLDEPEVNAPLENAAFLPRLEGVKVLPLSQLKGL